MDFTREPLVETVITPKDGYKLIIRPSNAENKQEYSVSAVEVVSFGNAFFFRSLEKPVSFLLSMTEYEVIESREVRAVLKKPQIEKPIKISGGKKVSKTSKVIKNKKTEDVSEIKEGSKKAVQTKKQEKKSSNKSKGEKTAVKNRSKDLSSEDLKSEELNQSIKEEKSNQPIKRTLLPPPTSLISEQIDKYKSHLDEHNLLSSEECVKDEKIEKIKQQNEDSTTFPYGDKNGPRLPSMVSGLSSSEEKVVDIIETSNTTLNDKDT